MAIALDLVRAHLKADFVDVETDLVKQYMASATRLCESFCSRRFYETDDDRRDDFPLALADKVTLATARDTLLGVTVDAGDVAMIWDRYLHDIDSVRQRINGIVQDDAIVAAILLTVGFLYTNRAAQELPEAAKRILQPYQWIGDLAWI